MRKDNDALLKKEHCMNLKGYGRYTESVMRTLKVV